MVCTNADCADRHRCPGRVRKRQDDPPAHSNPSTGPPLEFVDDAEFAALLEAENVALDTAAKKLKSGPDTKKAEPEPATDILTPEELAAIEECERRADRAYKLTQSKFASQKIVPVRGCPVSGPQDETRRKIHEECEDKKKQIRSYFKCLPELEKIVSLDTLLQSVDLYENAALAVQELGPKKKTVMATDTHFSVSGTSDKNVDNAASAWRKNVGTGATGVYISQGDIHKGGKELNYTPAQSTGAPYDCHADKQLTLYCIANNQPYQVMGDSRVMCHDCQEYFFKLADTKQTTIAVTDPSATKIFTPGGRVVTIFHNNVNECIQDWEVSYREPSTNKNWMEDPNIRGDAKSGKDAYKLWSKYNVVLETPDGNSKCCGKDGKVTTVPAPKK